MFLCGSNKEVFNTFKIAQLRKDCKKFLIQPWLVGFLVLAGQLLEGFCNLSADQAGGTTG